jgi:hypothetical protein
MGHVGTGAACGQGLLPLTAGKLKLLDLRRLAVLYREETDKLGTF